MWSGLIAVVKAVWVALPYRGERSAGKETRGKMMSGLDGERAMAYARERLTEWARWLKSVEGERLGLPPKACFVRDRIGDGIEAPLDDLVTDRAGEIERIVCRLREIRPQLFDALFQWYFLEKVRQEGAKACKCNVNTFRERLRAGEIFVAGALMGGD